MHHHINLNTTIVITPSYIYPLTYTHITNLFCYVIRHMHAHTMCIQHTQCMMTIPSHTHQSCSRSQSRSCYHTRTQVCSPSQLHPHSQYAICNFTVKFMCYSHTHNHSHKHIHIHIHNPCPIDMHTHKHNHPHKPQSHTQ